MTSYNRYNDSSLQSGTGKYMVLQCFPCNKNSFFLVGFDLQVVRCKPYMVWVRSVLCVPCKPYRVWVCSVLRVPCKPSRVWVCSVCRNLTKSFCKYEVDLFISADILSIIFHPYLKFDHSDKVGSLHRFMNLIYFNSFFHEIDSHCVFFLGPLRKD